MTFIAQELFQLFPKNAFKILPLKEMLKIGAQLSKSAAGGADYGQVCSDLSARWKLPGVQIVSEETLKQKSAIKKLAPADAERILSVYFYQWFDHSDLVHVDFRPHHFSSGPVTQWRPSFLRYPFSADFKKGVCRLYSGFYRSDSSTFEQGLSDLGILHPEMPSKVRSEVIHVFENNFGGAREGKIQFSLGGLKQSFDAIFDCFLKNKVDFNPEFAVLGLNLVTLYVSLQEVNKPLDVRGAFLGAASVFEK